MTTMNYTIDTTTVYLRSGGTWATNDLEEAKRIANIASRFGDMVYTKVLDKSGSIVYDVDSRRRV